MRLWLVLGVLAVLLASAPAASAASRAEIIDDCFSDSLLDGDYTRGELRDTLQHLPTDVVEYSDCPGLLRQALFGPGGPGGPVSVETPADQAAIDGAGDAGGRVLVVGGDGTRVLPLTPGRQSVTLPLPAPLTFALLLVGAAGLALVVPPLGRAVRRPS